MTGRSTKAGPGTPQEAIGRARRRPISCGYHEFEGASVGKSFRMSGGPLPIIFRICKLLPHTCCDRPVRPKPGQPRQPQVTNTASLQISTVGNYRPPAAASNSTIPRRRVQTRVPKTEIAHSRRTLCGRIRFLSGAARASMPSMYAAKEIKACAIPK